ncbi:BA14K family protein [Nitrobacter sp. JJSN]|uniref:BA14K family protein n=1 Tax=Nitrobacter sp. JJSN TaxID=3453033 RepID=UPI003F774A76
MFNFKPVLAAAAIIALAAPLAMTSPSFAQGRSHGGHAHMSHGGGGGGHMGMRPGGGGGGRHWAGGGGGRHWAGGGGGWHGGGWRGGGFYPGFVAGSAIGFGSSFASPYYYGDSYGYYDDSPAVEVVPSGGDDVAYCQQRYRSYDVGSGTYLGYDGLRHPCP